MLGIMIIDMQEGYHLKENEKKTLLSNQIKLLEYASKRNIPVFTMEYTGEGDSFYELSEVLKNNDNQFIKKYNDNSFVKITDKYVKNNLKEISEECILFGDEWNNKAPENLLLKRILKKKKIDKLILTGIYKNSCVFKTAKGAKKRGYEIFTSDELMDSPNMNYLWYNENSNHYSTLKGLLKRLKQ